MVYMTVSETPKLLGTSKLHFDHLLGIKGRTSRTRTVNACSKKCILALRKRTQTPNCQPVLPTITKTRECRQRHSAITT